MAVTQHPLSICIMRMSAIGDAVLTVPLVRTLQKALPESKITWITSPIVYSLLKGLDGVEFIVADKPRKPADYLALRKQFKTLEFDVLLAIQTSLRINLLYPMIRAKRKIGYDKTRGRDGQWLFTNERVPYEVCHTLDSFLSFARQLGIEEADIRWDLPIEKAHRDWAREQFSAKQDQPVIVINPAASSLERTWMTERYIETARQLIENQNARIVLTGGPTELEKNLARDIAQGLNDNCIDLVGRTNLKQLAAVLGEADCVIAPDTGPAHIATAMQTPVIGLYAVAAPQLWGPYLWQDFVINRHPQAIQQFLNKDPETAPPLTRVHKREAMALIEVKDVYEMTLKALAYGKR